MKIAANQTLKYKIKPQSIRYQQAREIVVSDWLTTITDLCCMISQISKKNPKNVKKRSNSDFNTISTSIIIIQKGLYRSMQTIDHQIHVEITVIMQRVGAQQHTC